MHMLWLVTAWLLAWCVASVITGLVLGRAFAICSASTRSFTAAEPPLPGLALAHGR
jgi:ABC-type sugar transport system permease subunit